jgi:hypothetical protein
VTARGHVHDHADREADEEEFQVVAPTTSVATLSSASSIACGRSTNEDRFSVRSRAQLPLAIRGERTRTSDPRFGDLGFWACPSPFLLSRDSVGDSPVSSRLS